MADGVRLTVRTSGVSLEKMRERVVDHRPAWEALGDLLLDPASYEGGRFSGLGTMPHGGPRKGPRERRDNDAVGYAPHLRLSRTKRRLRVTSSRVGVPPVTDATDDKVVEADVDYVIGADAPTVQEVLS